MWSNASTPLTFAFVRCTASRYGCFIPEDKAPGNARWTAENLRMWRGEKFAPLLQGCTNPPDGSASNLLTRRLISVRSSGRNVWLLAPRILRWLLYFGGGGKLCTPDSLQFIKQFQQAFFAILNSSQAPMFTAQTRSPRLFTLDVTHRVLK